MVIRAEINPGILATSAFGLGDLELKSNTIVNGVRVRSGRI